MLGDATKNGKVTTKGDLPDQWTCAEFPLGVKQSVRQTNDMRANIIYSTLATLFMPPHLLSPGKSEYSISRLIIS